MNKGFLSALLRRLPRAKSNSPAGSGCYRPTLELLEGRVVPSVTPAIRSIREIAVAGPQANAIANIQATVDAFRQDLGGPDNGNALGSQGVGRREINWDGVPDADSATARLAPDFFNSVAPRGAVLSGDTALTTFQVSADSVNAAGVGIEFNNINATYSDAFATFSAERLFSPLGDNSTIVEFFVPGTNERATVSGFGAIFTDVDTFGSSALEFFDLSGQLILERTVLGTPGSESLSFVGVAFIGSPIAKVRITSGNALLGDEDLSQGGTADMAALDDFIFGEPQPLAVPRVIAGHAAGGQVVVLNANTGAQLTTLTPFPGFAGGVTVAAGDVTGDGFSDIVVGAGTHGGSHVKVFDGVSFGLVSSFFAFTPTFGGSIYVAVGHVNDDGEADIIVGAGTGTTPHVKVISGANSTLSLPDGSISNAALLGSFYAFTPSFRGGVTVSAGDLDGDFLDDIIVGSAAGSSHVRVIDATSLTDVQSTGEIAGSALLRNFIAFGGFGGGVFVSGGDINADGRADIIVGAGAGAGPHVKGYSGTDNALFLSFFAYDINYLGGVRVDAGQFDNGRFGASVLTGQGPLGVGLAEIHGLPLPLTDQFLPFGVLQPGIFVASSRR